MFFSYSLVIRKLIILLVFLPIILHSAVVALSQSQYQEQNGDDIIFIHGFEFVEPSLEIINSGPITVPTNDTFNITDSELLAVDTLGQTASNIIWTVFGPFNGSLNLGPVFTQEDINNGNLFYTAPATSGTTFITFQVGNGLGTTLLTSLTITVGQANTDTPPYFNTPPGLCMFTCEGYHVSSSQLQAYDNEDGPENLIYSVITHGAHGVFLLNDVPSHNFTQQDVNSGRVTYTMCPIIYETVFTISVKDSDNNSTGHIDGIIVDATNTGIGCFD